MSRDRPKAGWTRVVISRGSELTTVVCNAPFIYMIGPVSSDCHVEMFVQQSYFNSSHLSLLAFIFCAGQNNQ